MKLTAVLLIGLFLAACSGPEVRVLSEPAEGTPGESRVRLSEGSGEVLRREGLTEAYRKDPHLAIRTLHQRGNGDDRLRAVAELCGALGWELEKSGENRRAVGCYLDAAELSQAGAVRGDVQLRLIYNEACSSLAALVHRENLLAGGALDATGPVGRHRLTQRRPSEGALSLRVDDELIPTDRIELSNVDLKTRRQDGIGGALVAHRARRQEQGEEKSYISPAGYAVPANATLTFPGGRKARLEVRNLMKVDRITMTGQRVPLAADWSTSLGYLYRYAPPANLGFKAMLRPEEYAGDGGLYEIHPYDSDKIPVVLVHGLMSSPLTWVEMLNVLRSDPVLRANYQGLLFRYPTGNPISRSAATLRNSLEEFRATYETDRSRAQMRRMVLIGHSMGGILSNLQIRDSGDAVRKEFFEIPVDQLEIPESQRASLQELYLFKPDPKTARAILIAAPHRGSELAQNPIGKLGSRLIRLPFDVLGAGISSAELLATPGLTPAAREEARYRPDGVRGLRPSSPFLKATAELPKGDTPFHSIIGRANPKDPVAESDDKVVPYWSSHLEGAESEKIVHATHTTITANREAIEEVRRILYLHLGRPAPSPLAD